MADERRDHEAGPDDATPTADGPDRDDGSTSAEGDVAIGSTSAEGDVAIGSTSAEGDVAAASPADRLRDLGGYIRDQRNRAQLSLRNLAKLAGVSNPYLSQIERGLRKPSAEILQAIAKALRVSAETLYVKAGILEEREGDEDIESTIARDRNLTEPQRQALVEMYRSFRRLHELEDDGVDTRAQADRVLDRAADAIDAAAGRVAPGDTDEGDESGGATSDGSGGATDGAA